MKPGAPLTSTLLAATLWATAGGSLGVAPAVAARGDATSRHAGWAGNAPAVPFGPGETLTYTVSWSNVLSAGTATLRVVDRRPDGRGGAAYYILAEAQSAGWVSAVYRLYYKLDTLVDVSTLLPVRASSDSQEGRRRRTKLLTFDRGRGTASYELRTATIVTRELDIPPSCHDALSVLYALRAEALGPSRRIDLPVTDSGKIYQVTFSVTGREPIRVGSRTVSAWRVVPTIRQASGRVESSGIVLWIADDGRRAPVKISVDLAVGDFVLTLASGA